MALNPEYNDAELRTLHALFPTADKPQLLAALPGRNWSGIQSKAHGLGIARNVIWPAAALAVLHQHYESRGAAFVGQLLGKHVESIHHKAAREGLRRCYTANRDERRAARERERYARRKATARALAERPAPPRPRVVAVKPAPPAPAPCPVAVKRDPKLSNHTAQKKEVLRRQAAAVVRVRVTAEFIRRLPANHPGRYAYSLDGPAGYERWRQQQQPR